MDRGNPETEMGTRAGLACVVTAIVLLATACGGGNGPAVREAGGRGSTETTPGGGKVSPSGPPTAARVLNADPCALINAQEVSAALGGGPATSRTIGAAGAQYTCDWRLPDRADYMMVTVNDLDCDG